jgi:hypothetical protein
MSGRKIQIIASLFLLLSFSFNSYVDAQTSKIKAFKNLTPPERRWVYAHPFIVSKSYKISSRALELTEIVGKDRSFDGDPSGGQVDAFRHGIWMALLVQIISEKKARSLGDAHEKGAWYLYKKSKTEDGNLPDKATCDMDYKNNEIGIKIGLDNKGKEEEFLVMQVKKAVLNGDFWIIKKDTQGNFVQCDGGIIKFDGKPSWENDKCLVKSNTKRVLR